MRGFDRQLFRFVFVLALGGGLAAMAAQPQRPKVAVREKPAPIILAAAFENAPPTASGAEARVDQCSLNPRDYSDDRASDKSGKNGKKRRVVVCG
jgi:hypothetical protein